MEFFFNKLFLQSIALKHLHTYTYGIITKSNSILTLIVDSTGLLKNLQKGIISNFSIHV